MKKPASFQIATTMTQASAVCGSPSQLRLEIPTKPVTCSSRPYCGVKKKSQMLATAIIGSTVGVKKAMRSSVRPRIAELTHRAIAIASAIETGIVPRQYQGLLVSDFQNNSAATITRECPRPTHG